MNSNQEIFIVKIDRFIRKYYQNQLLRGIIIGLLLLLCYFLFVSFSEYFLYFSVKIRSFLALIFIILCLFILIKLIVFPCTALLKIGKRISYLQAIEIISLHFPELEDRLVNILELTELLNRSDSEKTSLLLASINQRIDSIRLVSFRKAVSYHHNWKYLRYLGIVLFCAISLYLWMPDLYSKSTGRLVHFNRTYAPPADFQFYLDNTKLRVVKGSDFVLKAAAKGKYNPSEAYLVYSNNKFLLKNEGAGHFSYNFHNVNADIIFHLESGRVISKDFKLKALSEPGLRSSQLTITAPFYTKIPVKVVSNLADISIPVGSLLHFHLEGEETDSLNILFSDKLSPRISKSKKGSFDFSKQIFQDLSYKILLSNREFKKSLFAIYQIDIIPDFYPEISISVIQDSVIPSGYYFKGIIKDDYGFTNLRFVYETDNHAPIYIPVVFKKDIKSQAFYFSFDFSTVDASEDSKIKYYFEVFDNDQIYQPKMTRSRVFDYYIPDSKQIYDLNEIVHDSINHQMNNSMEISQSIQRDILKMQKNALDGHVEKWQQDQLFKDILQKKNNLMELLKEIRIDNQRKNQLLNSSGLQDSLLLEKQKQIDKLLDKVMDKELQKLFDQFNKLSEEFKMENLNKIGNQIKMSLDDFQKQMDRNLKLLERYEIEVKVKQLIACLEKLAEKQETILKYSKKDHQKSIDFHDNINKKWEDIRKDLSDILDKNSNIENPYSFDDFTPEEDVISDLINKTESFIENNKWEKISRNQKEIARRQRGLAQKLSEGLAKSNSVQLQVDIDNLIRLLNNLIEFSFRQEAVLRQFKQINYRNPRYVEIMDRQDLLKEEYKLVQDSLLVLSAHSPQVASLIGNRIFSIQNLMEEILDKMNNRQVGSGVVLQQKVLTETNELSLFLSEAIKQLMNQMANAMPGDQLGDKKSGKNAFPGLKSKQNSLKKMMQDLIQEMKDGKDKSGLKEKFGKMLQRQEMFQENLEEMLQNGDLGNESEKILREVIKMIDQTESDIYNFSINSTTILRQNKILSRLLQAENSEREKGFDKKRESNSGNNLKLSNPREIFEYKRVRTDSGSIFYDSNVKMFDYYNKLYLDYMIQINND
ncbi:hypothetical protein [Ancylomarina longa]|nr:hypothetical protein [Ancylomarina longa]